MKSFTTFTIVAAFAATALAGCSVGSDKPASADFKATPLDAQKSQYKFDATGGGNTFTWDFGDRTDPQTGKSVQHTYQYLNGKYSVTLTVKDKAGVVKTSTQKVQVGSGDNHVPVLFMKAEKRLTKSNVPITFDATESYDPDGDPLTFEWDFNDHRDQNAFITLNNMGLQQYGHYKYGPPKSTGGAPGNSSTGGRSNPHPGLTPSGYDWQTEYQKAMARVDELMGRKSRHVPGPEPRNTDLDGHINDTAPIQLYPFPSDATYFVVVRAVDIKGDYAEGYIRISVRDTPLAGYSGNETYDLADGKATLQPQGARDALDAANGGHDTGQSSWSSFRWTEEFPGNGTVEFTSITGSTDSVPNNPAQPAVVAYVCGAQVPVSAGGCDTYNAGAMAAGGHMLYFNITPLKVIYPNTAPYQLFILNKSDVTVMVEYKMHVKYDMNPWPEEYETQWGGP